MKKSLFLIVLVSALVSCNHKPTAQNAGAGEAQKVAMADGNGYALDTLSSTLNWIGSKPGGQHTGVVSIYEGILYAKNGKVVSGSFIINLTTITDMDITDAAMNAKLIGHLKSPDFFDVMQYPVARFELVSVAEIPEPKSDSLASDVMPNYRVTGNLKMKNITRSISFPAQIDITDNSIKAVTPPFAINRTEWGVNYGSKSIFAELKDKFIYDEIIITLNLNFKSIR